MEGKEYRDFYQLPIWREGYELLMLIYNISEKFPDWEKYALSSQIIRSANSIIANIAEAHGRFSFNDKIRVLYIARGELAETRSHLAVALGRKYINDVKFKNINIRYCDLAKKINLYINSLKQ